jgi:hypothetical protein
MHELPPRLPAVGPPATGSATRWATSAAASTRASDARVVHQLVDSAIQRV